MSAIKRTPADIAFSKLIRKRAGWKCERCGAQHSESDMGLHCSHYYSRGNWAVRFDPDNARSLCYGCHAFLGGRPAEHTEWFIGVVGQGTYDLLTERKNDQYLGREYRKTKGKGDIAKFYRDQIGSDTIERWL